MQQELKVAIIQADIAWKNPEKNLKKYTRFINEIEEKPDLIVLPESFNNGFCIDDPSIAEPMFGPSMEWMTALARAKDAVVIGSLFINNHNRLVNRMIWMRPDGNYVNYDKRHLYGNEKNLYTSGTERVTAEINGWKFRLNICYDLRFPVWSRNDDEYHVYLNVANWPSPRANAWQTLLISRAIENQAFAIGVNRIGREGNNHYPGWSCAVLPSGHYLYEGQDKEEAYIIRLSKNILDDYRLQHPFLDDADKFEIQ